MALTDEQRAMRRGGLTATDMSAVLGLNPWRSAFDVYVDKVAPQEHEGEQQAASEAIELGTALEPWIRQRYSKIHNVVIRGENETYQHPKKTLALATPDGLLHVNTVASVGLPPIGVLECKTGGLTGGAWQISKQWGEPGTDEVPQQYLIQCHWQLFVLSGIHPELEYADLAALIGNLGYREYRFLPDEELWGMLFEQARRFWQDHIVPRKPPEPGPSKDATTALTKLYPSHGEDLLESTPTIDALAVGLHEAQATLKKGEALSDGLKNQLRAIIAEAYGVKGEWGKAIWTKSKDSEKLDWKGVAETMREEYGCPEPIWSTMLKEHTTVRQGARSFRTYFKEPFFETEEEE